MKKLLVVLILFWNQSFSQTESSVIKNAISEGLYKNFSGDIFIKRTEDKSLLLFFSTKDGGENIFDKSILVETNTSLKNIEVENNDKCEVYIPMSRKFIVLNNITKKKIVFVGLYDVENAILSVSNKLAGQSIGHNFIGYGLSYMDNKWQKEKVISETSLNADIVLLRSNINIPEKLKENTSNVAPGGVTCHSGGPGSSQCSVEQGFPTTQVCSVTCTAGYYACCNTSTFKCKCVANGTPEK